MRGKGPLRHGAKGRRAPPPSASGARSSTPSPSGDREETGEGSVLTKEDAEALHPDDQARLAWDGAAHGGQRPPAGGWRTWVFLGGRGAGKTRAGAEWVSDVAARLGAGGRIALVGATLHDVRSVMVEGPSGLMNLPFRTPPRMESSLRRLVFPGGAVGVMLSAAEPERLRGPQFHAAWGDEFCAWERAEEVLAMLRMGLRLGVTARLAPRSDLRSAGGQAMRSLAA